MIDLEYLQKNYNINPPATDSEISQAEAEMQKKIPPSYVYLLKISNGLASSGDLMLHEAADIVQRNIDYQVPVYMPEYTMIGDDSGGSAILMKDGDEAVYEVDMGVMDEIDLRKSAASLEQLLVDFKGKTLAEREDGED